MTEKKKKVKATAKKSKTPKSKIKNKTVKRKKFTVKTAPGITIEKLTKTNLNTATEYHALYPHWDKIKIVKKLKLTLDGKDARYVAIKKSKIVGQIKVAFGKSIHKHRAELTSLIVLPTERKQGIGTSLTEYAINDLSPEVNLILLAVDNKNRNAISIYKKLGFKKYGVLKRASKIQGKYVDNLFMEKQI